jgi:cyclopropane-fatty-acyl-phospholipid synthase
VVARERATRAGVAGRVDVQLRDYRDVEGTYDAIVSVEMIEAVGAEYWPTYFRTLDRALAPGGRVGLQAILLAHDRMLATRDQYTWISKYIFPGGALPSLRAIEEIVRDQTRLHVDSVDAFGPDYARTLRLWREQFDAHAREVDALGFDRTFRRMWDFYLAYCEAGFATGYLDVAQIVMSA